MGKDTATAVSSGIGVLDKSVAVLHAIAEAPCNLSELCERTGLPRATAHRLAVGLETHRFLTRDVTGRWQPGPVLGELGGVEPAQGIGEVVEAGPDATAVAAARIPVPPVPTPGEDVEHDHRHAHHEGEHADDDRHLVTKAQTMALRAIVSKRPAAIPAVSDLVADLVESPSAARRRVGRPILKLIADA